MFGAVFLPSQYLQIVQGLQSAGGRCRARSRGPRPRCAVAPLQGPWHQGLGAHPARQWARTADRGPRWFAVITEAADYGPFVPPPPSPDRYGADVRLPTAVLQDLPHEDLLGWSPRRSGSGDPRSCDARGLPEPAASWTPVGYDGRWAGPAHRRGRRRDHDGRRAVRPPRPPLPDNDRRTTAPPGPSNYAWQPTHRAPLVVCRALGKPWRRLHATAKEPADGPAMVVALWAVAPGCASKTLSKLADPRAVAGGVPRRREGWIRPARCRRRAADLGRAARHGFTTTAALHWGWGCLG